MKHGTHNTHNISTIPLGRPEHQRQVKLYCRVSGVLIAFLSFFLNAYNIATGVLLYIAQAFVIGGGLVGASVYFRSKWLEFNTNAKKEIDDRFDAIERHMKE